MNIFDNLFITLSVFFLGVAIICLVYANWLYADILRDIKQWKEEGKWPK